MKNNAQVASVIQDCFTTQLQSLLGGATDDPQARQAMLDSRTDELGIDSLIAVEIRSWFMKNLNVNIPVLKILSGATVRNLIQLAIKELPKDLVPSFTEKAEDTSTQEYFVAPPEMAPLDSHILRSGLPHEVFTSSNTSSLESQSRAGSSDTRGGSTPASPVCEDAAKDVGKSVLASALPQRELPLSFSQSMFWFVTVLLQDKTTLNHFGYSRVHGNLRVNDLMRAVDVVAQRHEALRTRFFVDEAQKPMQGVLETPILRLEHKWVADETELRQECEDLRRHVYDLYNGETMRIVLLSKATDEHYLLIGCHHINVDGISHQVLMSDLLKAYNHEALNPSILQFPEYSSRQLELHRNGGWKSELAYWKRELAGYVFF